jgi:guanylate kinase
MDNNCVRNVCPCKHIDCVKGFIHTTYVSTKETRTKEGEVKTIETEYEGVLFCSTCYPERASIQSTSASSEEMRERLSNRSQFKAKENFEKEEASKTRTL